MTLVPGWEENSRDAWQRRGSENNHWCSPQKLFQGAVRVQELYRKQGYFITMNPGYAGRSELPDNLKADCWVYLVNLKFIAKKILKCSISGFLPEAALHFLAVPKSCSQALFRPVTMIVPDLLMICSKLGEATSTSRKNGDN